MRRPAHAKDFAGRAQNIPAEDTFMLPYQKRWIEDDSLMKLMEKGRRIGVSYATAYRTVRCHARKDRVLDTWVSSRDDTTAKLFVADCKPFAKVLHAAAQDLGERILDDKGNRGHQLQFANGTNVFSVASNSDVFAGKGGDVKLDEFALRQDPRGVFAIAGPTIDWGGNLEIISTHRGSQNYFNVLVDEARNKGNPKGFSVHRVTLQDALDQGFLWKLQTKLALQDPRIQMDEAAYFDYQRHRTVDEETFQQEYMCVPADDAGAFLPYDLIDGVVLRGGDDLVSDPSFLFSHHTGARCLVSPDWLRPNWSLSHTADIYGGFDVARVGDLSVVWLWEKIADIKLPRLVLEMDNVPFSAQEAMVHEIMPRLNVRRLCVDNTGLGRMMAERLQERFGQRRVEAVTFTVAVKEELAFPLRRACEDKSCRIPGDAHVIADLRKVRKETTGAGNVRFVAERGADGNGHADRFWAAALGLHAAKTTGGAFHIGQVKRPAYQFREPTQTRNQLRARGLNMA